MYLGEINTKDYQISMKEKDFIKKIYLNSNAQQKHI
jgi:hypothetical protein